MVCIKFLAIIIESLAKVEVIGKNDARGEAIPETCLNALGASLLRAMYQTGENNSIRTKLTIANVAAPLVARPRRIVIGQLQIIGIALIALITVGVETAESPLLVQLVGTIYGNDASLSPRYAGESYL